LQVLAEALRLQQNPVDIGRCRMAVVDVIAGFLIGVPLRVIGKLEVDPAREEITEQAPNRQRRVDEAIAVLGGEGVQQVAGVAAVLAVLHIGVGLVGLQFDADTNLFLRRGRQSDQAEQQGEASGHGRLDLADS
jgi:hypothetical protein